MMATGETFQADGELDIARSDNVLDLKVGELGVETKLLDDARVLARSELGIILGLGTGDNHLARSKDESSGLGFADTHDDSGETLQVKTKFSHDSDKQAELDMSVPLGCTLRYGRAER